MDYQQTIEYLLSRLPMFSRIGPAAFKKDLTNIRKLCDALGNPHEKFKSIHIGGTNGKGSVSHMLAAVTQVCGYRTGLYTSPHLKDFRERIRVDGQLIEEDFVTRFTEKIQRLIDEIEPSFFEISVAMAFDYFAHREVDIAIVEVGLGGRFDSTNILAPEISVITQIGRDHMNMLGNSLNEIAFEKAGIIKAHTPVVIGETHAETRDVFIHKAASEKAPIRFADQLRYVTDWQLKHHQLEVEIQQTGTNDRISFLLDLPGFYQAKNLVTLLEIIHQLRIMGWTLPEKKVHEALLKVKKLTSLHGRWELIHQNPSIILDVGHNEDGVKQIAAQLELSDYRHLHIVIGLVIDKEAEKILSLLPGEATYYFTQAQIPRALPAQDLQQTGLETGRTGKIYADVNKAIRDALQHAKPDDLILVCGSVFIVGEVDHSITETVYPHP